MLARQIVSLLIETRKQQKLTLRQLAFKSGRNVSTIFRMEHEAEPSITTVVNVARALGYDVILINKEINND